MMRGILVLFFLLSCRLSMAQSLQNDSSFVSEAKKNSVKLYSKVTGPQSHIYNGHAYIEYRQQEEEHPYFIDEWLDGTVVYEDELYENIPLLYDISNDEIITDHRYNVNKIQLIGSKVKSFTLQKHRFVNLNEENIPAGFYEILYDGQTKVYAQWRKVLQETITAQTIERRFDDKTLYFIRKDGKMISVKSKKSVLDVFADKKSELRKFLHANPTPFKADRAKNISQMAQHYDQLHP